MLLLFLDPAQSTLPSIARYQPGQLRDLQLHVLSVITNVSPMLPEHFLQINGHSVLVTFLREHSTDYERRMAVMRAISTSTAKLEEYKRAYAERGGIIELLIQIIKNEGGH